MNNSKPELITPDWSAPDHVKAFTTTRNGGDSTGAYSSFNLATHVNDDNHAVLQNRAKLKTSVPLPSEPVWLNQVHSKKVVHADSSVNESADGSWTRSNNVVCAVLTADCLPVLFVNRQGTQVACCHAGWRGLADGILTQTVQSFATGDRLLAWLGPAISQAAFEVGEEVFQSFTLKNQENKKAFIQKDETHWMCDLYALARIELAMAGVTEIYGGDYCTYNQQDKFYSYRRDGETGRMASLIWMA